MTLLERDPQGSVRWLQPTTSQVIFKCGFILLCSCTLSQEALSMIQSRKELNSTCWMEQESRWRGTYPFPSSFLCYFSLSSPIWYSWYTVSLCKLRSLTALTQERHTCKHVLQPVQNDQTLVNELVHVQSSPEAAKNDPCYSSDTTTGETSKGKLLHFTSRRVTDAIKATPLEMIDPIVKSNPLTSGLRQWPHTTPPRT